MKMMKAVAWNDAKAKLRTVAELQGFLRICGESVRTLEQERRATERWKQLHDTVEKFIKDFENDGLNE